MTMTMDMCGWWELTMMGIDIFLIFFIGEMEGKYGLLDMTMIPLQ